MCTKHRANADFVQEQWCEEHDQAPPKNATWMLKHFTSGTSPAKVLRSRTAPSWRTRPEPKASADTSETSSSPILTPSTTTSDHSISKSPKRLFSKQVHLNRLDQRIDISSVLTPDRTIVWILESRSQKLCNAHYLLGCCPVNDCPFDETSTLSDKEYHALLYLARSQRCSKGSECRSVFCFKGHMCSHGSACPYDKKCRFVDKHDIDIKVVKGTHTGAEESMPCTVL